MQLPETRFSRMVDAAIRRLGNAIAWVWLVLLGVIVCNVVLRYAFGEGRIEFEELQWHLYSFGMLLGLSYCYSADEHIRVDVLHERLPLRLQAWIELYGILLLLLPFIALVLVYSVPFVVESFRMHEVSASPGGLPLRWLIKAALPLGFVLLLAAALARLSRAWAALFGPDSGARDADQ
jgi:TRAP-type mannitol/chloroaromatic compound transport system permease small subunit